MLKLWNIKEIKDNYIVVALGDVVKFKSHLSKQNLDNIIIMCEMENIKIKKEVLQNG